jgi:outer membrane receptor protein involved in Fe transport
MRLRSRRHDNTAEPPAEVALQAHRLAPWISAALVALATSLPAQTVTLPAEVVTASRAPQSPADIAVTVKAFDGESLQRAPVATLDGALRSVPGFSLFRRSDSLTANPTAQGVSLRGLGPSGASRSLVLFDGVPLNDPFGGWVAWTKVPRESLARVEVLPGGGATAWGNAALGGIVQILGPAGRTLAPGANLTFGDFGTRSLEFAGKHSSRDDLIEFRGRLFTTNGFSLVAPERRGPIDVAAWSRHRWASLRWRHFFGQTMQLTTTARLYEEQRGNGTPYQRNSSREKFASMQLAGEPAADFHWEATAYTQEQSFASTFSSVNAARTAETPASDQFAVPAIALGAAWTGTWTHADRGQTNLGVDARSVHGETRENFSFNGTDFTRQRIAGGTQEVGGIFFLHQQLVAPDVRATLGARLDGWSDTQGHRRELDRASGGVSRDDRYSNRDGSAFSPSLGVVWRPSAAWRLRANIQRAFRRPTLNELYRPFRQGANVTEANPALETEQATSGEVGAEWIVRQDALPPASEGVTIVSLSPPRAVLTLGAVGFWNELRDAVGNVTLARGPGTFPLFGTLAAGGTGRQRLNLDRIRVQGLELSARWRPFPTVLFTGEYLYNDATVTRAALAPNLVGKRVAQVPRQSASLAASIEMRGGFTLTSRLRWIGRQFEDDENTLRLGEAVVLDLGLNHRLSSRAEIFVNVENLGDARVETGRSADGVVNVGTPRLALGGLRFSW